MVFNDEIETLLNKALYYGAKGDFTKVIKYLKRVLQLNTDRFQIWDLLSKNYFLIGDYGQAGLCKAMADELKNRDKKEKRSQQLYV
ncbi:hypothetical protein LCGC14_1076780 [marine sediment metagenome]|uniref:Uncharacterized protein n=1 Tax=marine sediment metagenome TaxID=412755 RepID=A0A0F9PZN2_9ZZZZ